MTTSTPVDRKPPQRRVIAIIGGGITGLSAAYEAAIGGAEGSSGTARHDVDVVVLDPAPTFGGKIATSPVELPDGSVIDVDEGPDAFLARVPWGFDLCRDLGITDDLVSPIAGALVERRGELTPLPPGLMLGVPTDLAALAKSRFLSPRGVAVAARDLLGRAKALAPDEDISVGEAIRSRLGDEVADLLVDPLLGAINAGHTDHLSVRAGAPQLAAALDEGGSLIRTLQKRQAAAAVAASTPAGDAPPVFWAHRDGMGSLIERLVDELTQSQRCRLLPGHDVRAISQNAGQYRIHHTVPSDQPASFDADEVIVATPAAVATTLLGRAAPHAAREIGTIATSSVVLVTMAFRRHHIGHELGVSGALVPWRADGPLTTAISFTSSKWPHLHRNGSALGPDTALLRVSAGRYGDTRALDLDDDELRAELLAELRPWLDLRGDPTAVRVTRYPNSFPQYVTHHLDRVALIEAHLRAEAPGIQVAGAPYGGIGIPACIRQGRDAARAALATR